MSPQASGNRPAYCHPREEPSCFLPAFALHEGTHVCPHHGQILKERNISSKRTFRELSDIPFSHDNLAGFFQMKESKGYHFWAKLVSGLGHVHFQRR